MALGRLGPRVLRFCSASVAGLLLLAAAASAQPAALRAGAQSFATNCSGCHGADGRGGERAPNIATQRRIVALSDVDLQSIIREGRPGTGMPAFRSLGAEGIGTVVAYLRSLQGFGGSAETVAGNPHAGHKLFFGRGGCSQCHMVAGTGGFIGPDLSDYGPGLSEAAIRHAIEVPDSHLPQKQTGVITLLTRSGETVSGVVRSEDNFNLVVQETDGRFRSFAKAQLGSIQRSSHSLMPHDLTTRLSDADLQDLVSYLKSNSSPASGAAQPAGQGSEGKQ